MNLLNTPFTKPIFFEGNALVKDVIVNFLHNNKVIPKELYALIEKDEDALEHRLSTEESQMSKEFKEGELKKPASGF